MKLLVQRENWHFNFFEALSLKKREREREREREGLRKRKKWLKVSENVKS